jgi:hypothetical protein
MKIEIRKRASEWDAVLGALVEAEWDWLFRADNGAPIARSMFSYTRRADAIHGALLTTGLRLPRRPLGCSAQSLANQTQPRGGYADVYVSYGSGGMVRFAQWSSYVGHRRVLVELVGEVER